MVRGTVHASFFRIVCSLEAPPNTRSRSTVHRCRAPSSLKFSGVEMFLVVLQVVGRLNGVKRAPCSVVGSASCINHEDSRSAKHSIKAPLPDYGPTKDSIPRTCVDFCSKEVANPLELIAPGTGESGGRTGAGAGN